MKNLMIGAAGATLIWLALGGVYQTERVGSGPAIYRLNRLTGAVVLCAPRLDAKGGRRVVCG